MRTCCLDKVLQAIFNFPDIGKPPKSALKHKKATPSGTGPSKAKRWVYVNRSVTRRLDRGNAFVCID